MAYAVIELLTLNFALNPPFRQTLVIGCPFLFGWFVVSWFSVGLVALLHFLLGFVRLEKCKCATKCVRLLHIESITNLRFVGFF